MNDSVQPMNALIVYLSVEQMTAALDKIPASYEVKCKNHLKASNAIIYCPKVIQPP